MRRLAGLAVVVVVIVLVACSGTEPPGVAAGDSGDTPDTTDPPGPGEQLAPLMAAALEELVTSGQAAPQFTEYLIQSNVEPDGAGRALTAAEREAIEQAIQLSAPVRWIEDPEEWRTDDLRPGVDGSAIVGVGEPTVERESALVPVSLWCGGLCGTWLTYRLALGDDGWQVTGIEGPVAVA